MKALIVYYSMNGNTEYAARKIAERTGAETLRLEPVKAYPDRGVRKFLRGGKSAMMEEKPELRPYRFEAEKYDTIIFGFPAAFGSAATCCCKFQHKSTFPWIFQRCPDSFANYPLNTLCQIFLKVKFFVHSLTQEILQQPYAPLPYQL